eukprot:7777160-Heterocapsa_arctica.AAC.1
MTGRGVGCPKVARRRRPRAAPVEDAGHGCHRFAASAEGGRFHMPRTQLDSLPSHRSLVVASQVFTLADQALRGVDLIAIVAQPR